MYVWGGPGVGDKSSRGREVCGMYVCRGAWVGLFGLSVSVEY